MTSLWETVAARRTKWIRTGDSFMPGADLIGTRPGRVTRPRVVAVPDRLGAPHTFAEAVRLVTAGDVPLLWPPRVPVPAWLTAWLADPVEAHRALLAAAGSGRTPGAGLIGVCSSGTAGNPKVVFLDEVRCLRNAEAVAAAGPSPDTVVSLRSIAYSAGLVADALGSLVLGSRLVVPAPAIPELYVRTQRRNALAGVSLRCTAAVAERLPRAGTAAPDQVVLSGDLVSREVVDDLRRWSPAMDVRVAYGLAEAGPRVAVGQAGAGYRTGELPASLPGVRIAVVEGELVAETPYAALAVLDDLGLRPIDGARIATGDLAWQDADRIVLTGRRSARFPVAGHWVQGDRVEAELRAEGLDARVAPVPGGWRVSLPGADPEQVRRVVRSRFPFLPAPEVTDAPVALSTAGKRVPS